MYPLPMKLNHDQCYAIIESRDARFDGRFYTAVKTTGIYCRPICSARSPLSKNVSFYHTAAAAAKAGFRPCLRCRPEASPGMADWLDTSELVSRGLRLINEGVFDQFGASGLADRLHISPRHLQRLFVQYLGVSPVAVAQTRRALFARKLIIETTLPMTEVAFSAGYKSIRRFNDAIRATYGNAPTAYRKLMEKRDKRQPSSIIQLKLTYRPPYDWASFFQFIEARAIPSVEWMDGLRYARTVRFGEQTGVIEFVPLPEKNSLLLKIPVNLSASLLSIVEQTRRFFDLRADPLKIEHHLMQDAHFSQRIDFRHGLRVPGAWNGFELAVRTILGQQITVKAATTMAGRLVEAFGESLPEGTTAHKAYIFPTPNSLLDADLTALGIIRQRAAAIQGLAQRVVDGRLQWRTHADIGEVIDSLVAIPGIGKWTANYIAMRALNEPDAFPAGDLILRRAFGVETEKEMMDSAEAWRPWRAYAAMQLWHGYKK